MEHQFSDLKKIPMGPLMSKVTRRRFRRWGDFLSGATEAETCFALG
jgi:hypothetical protein